MIGWGNKVEIETRRRIMLAVWAYAYEFHDRSIVSDAQFDMESYMVDLSIDTGRPDLDFWFRGYFAPHTGQWIHRHPEIDKIKGIYAAHFS